MTYVSDAFGSADNVDQPSNDARFGSIDAALVFDLTVHCQILKNCRLLAGVSNLFDEEYITSRLPHGPRTGAPRAFNVGLEYTF